MVNDLYIFDLDTFVWERIPPLAEDDVPRARYFHSADTCEFFYSYVQLFFDSTQGTINWLCLVE